jgi:serine protease Do
MNKKLLGALLSVLFIFTLAGCQFQLRAEVPYVSPHPYEELRINMIAEVSQSVVVVKTESGHGSGIIYKSEPIAESTLTLYYVMTNHHVVEDGGEMKVHFGAGEDDINVRDYASYELYDIAVVRFETDRVLRVHPVGPITDNTITEIVLGQDVYAIGTPQDIKKFNYVTQGVVSMVSFPYNNIPGLTLMHDAELNPGNSGGPLFNLNGDLIGINVAKIASVQTSDGSIAAEGLNYALSINKIAPIVSGFSEESYTVVERRPRLGVTVQEVATFLETNDPSLLPANPVGVVVIGFDMTRNAYEHMEIYDLIVEMNGIAITSIADLAAQLADAEFGDSHVLKVMRKVGTEFQQFTVTIILS